MSDEPEMKKEEAEKNEFSWPWNKDKDKEKVGASIMSSCGWSKLFQVMRIWQPNLLWYVSSGFLATGAKWLLPRADSKTGIKIFFSLCAAEYSPAIQVMVQLSAIQKQLDLLACCCCFFSGKPASCGPFCRHPSGTTQFLPCLDYLWFLESKSILKTQATQISDSFKVNFCHFLSGRLQEQVRQ